MLTSIANIVLSKLLPTAAVQLVIKTVKYFIDATIRDKVVPVPGSVLYCDLGIALEHSGIYVGDGRISNIVVSVSALRVDGTVTLSSPQSFTSKSMLGSKIYVSCDHHGSVGNGMVSRAAEAHVGERSFYGGVISNCHQFSGKCVSYLELAEADSLSPADLVSWIPSQSWDPTLSGLKDAAYKNLGASKWRLWDWDGTLEQEPPPEPDWQAHIEFFQNQALNPLSIAKIRDELDSTLAYEAEIADEAIPAPIRQRLSGFRKTLVDISKEYERVKEFLDSCPYAQFSYAELKAYEENFAALATELQHNTKIKELVRKMGRNYISEERKKQVRIPQASKSEVHGTHRSDDVMRMLPSELLNLDDETLEVLFYAHLLEKNLLSYELRGVTFINGETTETHKMRTGPVVACLDTSGSMQGAPLLKAKALLLAIANILKREDRALHVLLFGAAGEVREFSMDGQNDAVGLLKFLRRGFGGGTDFETPLGRAFEIIQSIKDYKKADILMLSDGDCSLSPEFTKTVKSQKNVLNCMVYSVLCAGSNVADSFSDEVVVL